MSSEPAAGRVTRGGLIALIALGGCVLDTDHVSTRLYAVCADDVPLLFQRASEAEAVAQVAVDDVGAKVDQPDAVVTFDALVVDEVVGLADLSFASTLTLAVVVPDAALPTAEVVDASITGELPLTATGDASINLVDYLTADSLSVRVGLLGAAPADAFIARMSLCLDVSGIEISEP